MTIKKRIETFIEHQGIRRSVFEKTCGFSNGYTRNLKENPSATKIEDILKAYPELNRVWLLTGEGEMLNAESQNSEQDTVYVRGTIPFYDAETTGGLNGSVSCSGSAGEIRGYIHSGDWFAGRETAAIRHVGESMIEYPNGCILAVREVLDRNLLVPGKNYVIETLEYRVTKRVQHGSSSDTIFLYSSNQEKYDDGRLVYEPFEVRLTDVRRIFSVLGYIVNQSGDFKLIKD